MIECFEKISNKLEKDIEELTVSSINSLETCALIINVILECLNEPKKVVLEKGFKNINEEIHFFKHQKPIIVSKLIYSMLR